MRIDYVMYFVEKHILTLIFSQLADSALSLLKSYSLYINHDLFYPGIQRVSLNKEK
jgi:hypothetical protein